MPIYDYRCDACGHAFSAVRSYSEGPVETCPKCGKRPRRLITAPAVVFKGSGWYKTDSRGAAPKEEGAKPAEKTETKTSGDATVKSSSETPAKSSTDAPAKGSSPKSEAKS